MGTLAPQPLGYEAWNTLIPTCVSTTFRRCKSNHLGVGRVPKFGGRWALPSWKGHQSSFLSPTAVIIPREAAPRGTLNVRGWGNFANIAIYLENTTT